MKMLAGIVAALVLVGVTSSYAQIVYPGPPYRAPPVVVKPAKAPRVVVAPTPPGPPGAVVVNPYTGRWCTMDPTGWRYCYTPF